jgi:tRNA nucleotidyltransferase (CCA-adding enzyme)
MVKLAPLMDNLARERVWDELCKLILLADAEDLLRFAPVITQVIPELAPLIGFDQKNRHHIYDIYTHTAQVVQAVPQELTLRWAALLHDIGKPASFTLGEDGQGHFYGHAQISAEMADAVLRRLKAPVALRERTVLLIDKHMVWLEVSSRSIRRWISRLGMEAMDQLMILQEADTGGKGTENPAENPYFSGIHAIIRQIKEDNTCLTLKDLAVNGHDLMALGCKGKAIGENLNRLLGLVLDEKTPNEKAALLAALQEDTL